MRHFTADDLIACYRRGVFPMAESREDEGVFLVDPDYRCTLPLRGFHIPKRLKRTMRTDKFHFTIDRDFEAIIDLCAEPAPDREDTWINADIRGMYLELHERGVAHSVETRHDGKLVGGLYGVAIGAAFFGESMFSRETDASKAALVQLAARLRQGRFRLLDAQFLTQHLEQFGAQTAPRKIFKMMLEAALKENGDFFALPETASGSELLSILEA